MHATRLSSSLIRLLTSTASVAITILFFSALAAAQDSPGRFEAGAAFSTLRLPGIAALGPAVEGDVNFGRHIAMDGAFSWRARHRCSWARRGRGRQLRTPHRHGWRIQLAPQQRA